MDGKQVNDGPIIIETKGRLAGICMEHIADGDAGTIETCGYHAFDEGLIFYKMLESFDEYVRAANLNPSMVDRMLVVISPTETRIYSNKQFPLLAAIRPKGKIRAGQPVGKDHIVGCTQLSFGDGIQLPPESGFMLLVSAGWRRGICFDFRPLAPTADEQVSTEQAFEQIKFYGGMLWSHLLFTERFLLTSDDWKQIVDAGWFPFLLIPDAAWEGLVSAIRAGANLDKHETAIHNAFLNVIDDRLRQWRANRHLRSDAQFLRDAVDLYKNEKWAACVSLVLPRIEGLLCRAFQVAEMIKTKEFLARLEAELKTREHPKSLLFPDRFVQFMKKAVYPYTNFADPQLPATRHTVGHGRVEYEVMNCRKPALTTFLLIDNLLYCMPRGRSAVAEEDPGDGPADDGEAE